MKHLAMAFAMSGAAALLLYVLANLLVTNHEACFGIAALPFVAVTHVFETLERDEVKKTARSTSGKAIASYAGFTKPWRVAVLGAVIVFAGVALATNFLAGVWIGLFVAGANLPIGVFLAISVPVNLTAAYFVGRWIGARCATHGIAACVAVGSAGSLLVHGVDNVVARLGGIPMPYPISLDAFAIQVVSGAVLFSLVLAIGYWRGRKNRQAAYVRYLLAILPANTREVLIALAYEEAQSLSVNRPEAVARHGSGVALAAH